MRLPIIAGAVVLALSAAAIGQVAGTPVDQDNATGNGATGNAANAADMPAPDKGVTGPVGNTAAPNAIDGDGTDEAAAAEPVATEAKPPR